MSLWVNAEWLDRCRFMKLLVISRALSWLYQPSTGKKEEWQTCYSTITNVAFNFLPKFRPIPGINLGFDLMDPGQVFVSHNLPGPGLAPLQNTMCTEGLPVQNAKPGQVLPLQNANIHNMNIRYKIFRGCYLLIYCLQFAFCTETYFHP